MTIYSIYTTSLDLWGCCQSESPSQDQENTPRYLPVSCRPIQQCLTFFCLSLLHISTYGMNEVRWSIFQESNKINNFTFKELENFCPLNYLCESLVLSNTLIHCLAIHLGATCKTCQSMSPVINVCLHGNRCDREYFKPLGGKRFPKIPERTVKARKQRHLTIRGFICRNMIG